MKLIFLVLFSLHVVSDASDSVQRKGIRRVVQPEPPLPSHWESVYGTSLPLPAITFRLSLKQPGLKELRNIAERVSNPSDTMYGKYLTQNELDTLMAPPTHAVSTAMKWAAEASCNATVLREVVTISCDAPTAEALLETSCRRVENHITKQNALRCSDYSLPEEVHKSTQAVYGLHGLPVPPRKSKPGRRLQSQAAAKVTPTVLTSTYKVGGVTPSGSEKNRQAVAEFQEQTMSTKDLDMFWKTYMPDAKPELGKVFKYVGDNGTGSSQTEADLDIQYIMGIAPGILTEFWLFKPMDFCGDLKNWTQTILSTESPPLVHSVSYGVQGNITSLMGCKLENVEDVDTDFAKLAARGITIVFASGDSGAGYSPPQPKCDPPPSLQQGTEIEGTVHQTLPSISSMEQCCYVSSNFHGVAWTYEVANQETCSSQLRVKGVTWSGEGVTRASVTSADACCTLAFTMHAAAWSFHEANSTCVYFREVNGRIPGNGSESGMGKPPPTGKCTIFSTVTGKKTNPQATSASIGKGSMQLYPSWPASSPWVTSVGSTRFVDQKVGQPEMATDQFGSGGGFSVMFDAFSDQKAAIDHYLKAAPQLPPNGSFPSGGRGTPDVSALGEGYQVVIQGQSQAVGGTSASAPMFAGLVSLLNEARLAKNMPAMGYLNPWLYKHADVFTDITRGDNLRGRGPFVEPYGFNCTEGWDPVTGLGTPRFDKMLAAATASSIDIVV